MTTRGPILHLNGETSWRGGEAQVFLLAHRLKDRVPTAVACVRDAPLWRRCVAAGITVHHLPESGGLGAVLALRQLCGEIDPAIVHAHTSRTHQVARLGGRGRPLVVSRRVSFSLRKKISSTWKYGAVDRFIAVSRSAREGLLGIGVKPERITVIHDGVDETVLDAARPIDFAALGLPADAEVVLCVAALSADKDHAGLLAAWPAVAAARPNAHLVLAGGGTLEDTLREQIRSDHLERVHLLGFRDDIPALLKAATLLVMNSRNEGLCSAILEAKRCGLPVVSTAVGGIPEIITHDVDGFLLGVRDPALLAQAVIDLLADGPRRERYATAARAASTATTATAMAEAHLAVYRDLLGGDAWAAMEAS